MPEIEYPGDELELFARAENWAATIARQIGPALRGRVLEVGAGMGTRTLTLPRAEVANWVCLEPDPHLAETLRKRTANLPGCEVHTGTLEEVEGAFDAVCYLDVLEHIEDDRGQLERAKAALAPGGRLVILVPAHQWLFSPFDAAVGHHRRYSKRSLEAVIPDGLVRERWRYLDAVGLGASIANKLVLGQSQPSLKQILTWDRLMVPVSRRLDPCLGYKLGKSLLGIWRRD